MALAIFVNQINKTIMKNYIILIAFLLLGIYKINAQCCKPSDSKLQTENTTQQKGETVKLKITGMTCAGCSNHVSSALKNIDGVIEQNVEYPGDIAIVKYDASKTNPTEMIKAIEKVGYKAEIIKETTKKKV